MAEAAAGAPGEAWRDAASPIGGEETNAAEAALEIGAAPAPDELTMLKQELEAAKVKAAENLDGWQRAAADLANYRKRIEREKSDAYQTTTAAVIARILPALDDFDRAMREPFPADESQGAFQARWDGIALIHRKLQTIVENEGVTRIEADGAMFDPNLHEAVTHDESENHAEGQIIEVLRQGYRMGDRVLRPALVRVAK